MHNYCLHLCETAHAWHVFSLSSNTTAPPCLWPLPACSAPPPAPPSYPPPASTTAPPTAPAPPTARLVSSQQDVGPASLTSSPWTKPCPVSRAVWISAVCIGTHLCVYLFAPVKDGYFIFKNNNCVHSLLTKMKWRAARGHWMSKNRVNVFCFDGCFSERLTQALGEAAQLWCNVINCLIRCNFSFPLYLGCHLAIKWASRTRVAHTCYMRVGRKASLSACDRLQRTVVGCLDCTSGFFFALVCLFVMGITALCFLFKYVSAVHFIKGLQGLDVLQWNK